jgi:hypothetical protein
MEWKNRVEEMVSGVILCQQNQAPCAVTPYQFDEHVTAIRRSVVKG